MDLAHGTGPETAADARPARTTRTRRAPWSGRSPVTQDASAPGSPRDRLIDAAITCIRRNGIERTSISAIAAIAGVSRPTVYAHFETREALVAAALERASAAVSERVVAAARRRAKTAPDFAVEALVAARREFLADPALNPITGLGSEQWSRRDMLSGEALEIARRILGPIVDYDSRLEPHLDEICETIVRWLLSLVTYDSARTSSEPKLREYLRRSVAPVIAQWTAEGPASSS